MVALMLLQLGIDEDESRTLFEIFLAFTEAFAPYDDFLYLEGGLLLV